MSRIFRNYIRKKIRQEYENYFKKLIQEAKENYQSSNNAAYAANTNMREIAGIKVGLDFLKQQEIEDAKEAEEYKIKRRSDQHWVYRYAYIISGHSAFLGFMALSIILNTLVLSLDRYPVDLKETAILEKVNILFTVIFTLEMVFKMLAVGIRAYFRGGAFNIFDCVIVIASITDIFMANFLISNDQSGSGSAITALRGFRLLRIFKLAKTWKRFELLLETLGRTLVDIATFSILLFLFIFIFSLLGLELFAYRAKFDEETDSIDL